MCVWDGYCCFGRLVRTTRYTFSDVRKHFNVCASDIKDGLSMYWCRINPHLLRSRMILCSLLCMCLWQCTSHLSINNFPLCFASFFCMLWKLDLCIATALMIAPLKTHFWTLHTNTHYTIWIDATANAMLAPMQMSFFFLL